MSLYQHVFCLLLVVYSCTRVEFLAEAARAKRMAALEE
jgi:hypothetical protein